MLVETNIVVLILDVKHFIMIRDILNQTLQSERKKQWEANDFCFKYGGNQRSQGGK